MEIIVEEKELGVGVVSKLLQWGNSKGNHVVGLTWKSDSLNMVFTGWPSGWNEWEDLVGEKVIRSWSKYTIWKQARIIYEKADYGQWCQK